MAKEKQSKEKQRRRQTDTKNEGQRGVEDKVWTATDEGSEGVDFAGEPFSSPRISCQNLADVQEHTQGCVFEPVFTTMWGLRPAHIMGTQKEKVYFGSYFWGEIRMKAGGGCVQIRVSLQGIKISQSQKSSVCL